MRNKKTKTMVLYAFFIAIEIILVCVPFLGFIPLGFMNATTLHIPVIIAGIVLGPSGGGVIGLVFGLCSLINATLNPTVTSFVFSPFISGNLLSLVIAIVPRVLCGYLSGVSFIVLQKISKKKRLIMFISGIIGSFTNTIFVLGGIYFIFGTTYSQTIGIEVNTLLMYFITVVGIQAVVEALLGSFISCSVAKPLLSLGGK
ncbi:ECF transporter S component [Tannockella kyphosi]|uniref:ECF transporter S component n=1 Tax=Tannockella kyphosi TaxID=2899121 RepID=UPI0020120F3A|nr:ECF transporter S component [Tannockella kyphosi]